MKASASPADYETRIRDVLDLRAFALTSDMRSLTAAARIMGESKATVSRRLTRLEGALGTALLLRSSRGIDVTDEGRAYRTRIAEVLERLGEANAAAEQGGQASPSGSLRISAPPGYGNALAPHFAGFCDQYPQVALVVHLSSRFVELEAEHFDVALRATANLADSSLVALRVGDAQPEGILVAAPSYLKKRPAPRHPDDLSSHRILAVGDTSSPSSLTLQRRGTPETADLRLRVAVAGSDLGFLKEMAVHGAGITVLPRLNVQRELDDGRLVNVLPEYVWPTVSLFLIHRGGPFVPPKVRAFVDYLQAALIASRRKPLRRKK